MALGKGIPLINGFDLNSKLPLDSRTVADTKENMNKLVTDGSVGDGQLCYCKADKKLYVLKEGAWSEVGGSGGGIPVVEGTKSTTKTDGAYATYTIPEAQTSCFIFKCDLGTAFISYNNVFGTYNGYLDAEGEVTNGSLKLNDLIVLSGSGTTINVFFGNIAGGGKSVPPTLYLINLETSEVRTTITEEEKTNLENGLYNQVIYATESDFAFIYSPSKLFGIAGEYYFTQFKIVTNADGTPSYSSMVTKSITIGEKNTSNEYPITVNDAFTINPPSAGGGGGSGGPLLDMFPYWNQGDQTVTQTGFDLLTQKLFNNEIVGISLGEVGTCMLLNDITGGSISFIGPYSGNDGRFKATFKLDLSVKTEYVDKGGSPISLTLPQTAPSSQVIPSITTANTQQNLTIGDGLTIENGALKTTSGGGGGSGEEILNVFVSMTTQQLSNAINKSGPGTNYTEEDKTIVFNFIKAQKGIMRLTVSTPIGRFYMTLRPAIWKDNVDPTYDFEGSIYLQKDLSEIGANLFNQIIVRAICWDSTNQVVFKPTIIPIGVN